MSVDDEDVEFLLGVHYPFDHGPSGNRKGRYISTASTLWEEFIASIGSNGWAGGGKRGKSQRGDVEGNDWKSHCVKSITMKGRD